MITGYFAIELITLRLHVIIKIHNYRFIITEKK